MSHLTSWRQESVIVPQTQEENEKYLVTNCSPDLSLRSHFLLCICFSSSNFFHITATATRSLQSCPTLCNPIDGSPPGSPVPGILQARTLEWVAISFSSAWKWKVKVKSLTLRSYILSNKMINWEFLTVINTLYATSFSKLWETCKKIS